MSRDVFLRVIAQAQHIMRRCAHDGSWSWLESLFADEFAWHAERLEGRKGALRPCENIATCTLVQDTCLQCVQI